MFTAGFTLFAAEFASRFSDGPLPILCLFTRGKTKPQLPINNEQLQYTRTVVLLRQHNKNTEEIK